MSSPETNKMKNKDFMEYGNSSRAFVKKEINKENFLENDIFSVYCADGTLLAAFESKESAIAAIKQSGLEYINLH